MDILFWILGFDNVMIPIAIDNQTLVLFWNETSRGVMNFEDDFLSSNKSYEQLYWRVTL